MTLALSITAVVAGLAVLAWSSDVFVDGAASLSRRLGLSRFIVGMVVIGFGTSAPELCVSILSGIEGSSELSLGNAYGSCIFNIAAILGVVALVKPIAVKPSTAFVGAPLLAVLSAMSAFMFFDCICSRAEAFVLLGVFAVVMPLYCVYDQKQTGKLGNEDSGEKNVVGGSVLIDISKTVAGLVLLVLSSYALVWGSVNIATALGASQLIIGLTIVAAGTSLPELASAVAAARRSESELVLGNIVGSNLFNTLAVVGAACAISPAEGFSALVARRDLPLVFALSAAITMFGMIGVKTDGNGRIDRAGGILLLVAFTAYSVSLAFFR